EFVPENEEQPVVIAEPDRIGAEVSDPLISPRGKTIGEDAGRFSGLPHAGQLLPVGRPGPQLEMTVVVGTGREWRLPARLFVKFGDESIDAGPVESQPCSVGRPGGVKAIIGGAVGQASQTAAVEICGPYFVITAAVGVEGDSFAVRGPSRHAVAATVVGQLARFGAVPSGDEEVFLRAAESVKGQPLAVRRKLGRRYAAFSAGDGRHCADDSALLRIESDALNILFDDV